MIKILRGIAVTFFVTATFQNCQAQFGHYGLATLVVSRNGQTKADTFKFKDFPETNYGCRANIDGSSDAEITFECGSFQNKDGSTHDMSVVLKITPGGVGKFILHPSNANTPSADIAVMDNDIRLALGEFDNKISLATEGSITITQFPLVDGDVKGTYQAFLFGGIDGKDEGYYNVSGSFSIKRTE